MKIGVMNISDYEQVYQLWLSCAGVVLNNLDDSKEGIATKLVNEAILIYRNKAITEMIRIDT